jgi:DNA mismatch repair protein MutS
VIEELPLFAAASHETVTESGLKDARKSALLEALGELEPDQVSPRAALEMLYRLKAMADNEEQT